MRCDRIEAPWVLDGPINGESFRTYVNQVLAPTLKPGDVVILDNLGSHKGKAVRRAIRASGARLLLNLASFLRVVEAADASSPLDCWRAVLARAIQKSQFRGAPLRRI